MVFKQSLKRWKMELWSRMWRTKLIVEQVSWINCYFCEKNKAWSQNVLWFTTNIKRIVNKTYIFNNNDVTHKKIFDSSVNKGSKYNINDNINTAINIL